MISWSVKSSIISQELGKLTRASFTILGTFESIFVLLEIVRLVNRLVEDWVIENT